MKLCIFYRESWPLIAIHSGKDWLYWAKGKNSLHNGGFSMNYRLLTVAQQPVQFVQWLPLPGGGDRSSALKNLIIDNSLLLLDYSILFKIDPLLFQIKYKKISSAFFSSLFLSLQSLNLNEGTAETKTGNILTPCAKKWAIQTHTIYLCWSSHFVSEQLDRNCDRSY